MMEKGYGLKSVAQALAPFNAVASGTAAPAEPQGLPRELAALLTALAQAVDG